MDQLLGPPGEAPVIALTIYSRPGCHLCEEMKTVVARVARRVELTLHEVDISTDPALEQRFGLEIPVLWVDEKKIAKYRVTETELTRILAARAGGAGQAGRHGRTDRLPLQGLPAGLAEHLRPSALQLAARKANPFISNHLSVFVRHMERV